MRSFVTHSSPKKDEKGREIALLWEEEVRF
jgi:hypothetical protein